MPYILEKDRNQFDSILQHLPAPGTSGELNYVFTWIAVHYLNHKGLSYQTCADIVSAFENAKHEFQRRVQDPYEDSKIKTNGDVY